MTYYRFFPYRFKLRRGVGTFGLAFCGVDVLKRFLMRSKNSKYKVHLD